MKYVLLILDTPEEPKADTPEYGAWYAEVGAWYEKWGATGRLDGGHQLQAASAAKTVRGTTVTDGPFIETKEQLGGFILLEVRDLDEALGWAERTPWNRDGCATEIRPLMDYDAYAARAAAATGEATAS